MVTVNYALYRLPKQTEPTLIERKAITGLMTVPEQVFDILVRGGKVNVVIDKEVIQVICTAQKVDLTLDSKSKELKGVVGQISLKEQ